MLEVTHRERDGYVEVIVRVSVEEILTVRDERDIAISLDDDDLAEAVGARLESEISALMEFDNQPALALEDIFMAQR